MPGLASCSEAVRLAIFSEVIRSYSCCPAVEGTLPRISAVTSLIERMKRTLSPGAGISSWRDMAQKPFFR